ncbi:helix-turn-helix domain-containing protein [Oceanobacillus oncorhynchi]|uniref:helix-turn-helix domain-containing protein n=1 Tax=Oceanobacillus oncorhynchi TaxID=545501 RepID=UPI0034D5D460
MTKATTIGHRIKIIRENSNLSQEGFAKRINISTDKLSDWENENNESIPAAKPLFAIINEFSVSSDWLLYGEESNDSIKGENLTSIHLKLMGLLKDIQEEDFAKESPDYNLSKTEQYLIDSFRDLEFEEKEDILKIIDEKLDK